MLILFLALLCFAGTILLQKFVLLSGIPIMAFVALRTVVPGSIIFLMETWRNKLAETKKIFTTYFFALTFATTLLPLFLKNFAHRQMPSAKFALLNSLDPFITSILVYFLFNETINLLQAAGIFCAVLGVGFLSTDKLEIIANNFFTTISWPELLTIVSVTLGRLGWIAGGSFIKNYNFTEAEINILFMLLPGLPATLYAITSGELSSLMYQTKQFEWLMIFASINLNTLGCLLMTKSLKTFNAVTISLAGTSIIPLTVALASFKLYNEPISTQFIIASGLVFLGLAIFYSAKNKQATNSQLKQKA